jgi:hypothetical protein
LEEWEGATITDCGVTVIKVKKHKTGKFGTAKLTMDPKLARWLRLYVNHLRPLAVREGFDPGSLFVLPGRNR